MSSVTTRLAVLAYLLLAALLHPCLCHAAAAPAAAGPAGNGNWRMDGEFYFDLPSHHLPPPPTTLLRAVSYVIQY
jgi:hypothetical protein